MDLGVPQPPPVRVESRENSAANLALVFGIIAIVVTAIAVHSTGPKTLYLIGGIGAVLAICLGAAGFERSRQNDGWGALTAMAGLVCGILPLFRLLFF